ncbi:transcription factor gsfR2 [Colletotrichum liriopes]|uniref:Transcription factor gsfR2 n=1 Tax=Colletotrichum liriopes TaxID=708192 RepID=A0AA37GW41_9PEZI|nr:transcription factor gsfR2 [Colletotrichum liriopes]
MDEAFFAPSTASGPNTAGTTASSSSSSATNQADTDTASHLSLHAEGLNWFLQSPSWTITYQRSPPNSVPPAAVFTNFVRGLQSWLVRFLHKSHNPFIHRHLYSETTLPHCMQDAYAAIAIAQTVTSENEPVVDAVSNSYVMNLLAAHSTTDPSFMPLLSTSEHLARTQALLIHLLLSLFSPSISRRAKAESLIDTIRLWARQLWESATVDATTSPIFPNTLSMSCDQTFENDEVVPRLYQAFILSESIRRTFLLTSIATGVYTSLKATWSHGCHGDVCITLRGELWEAPSAARWEAVARREDPLFLYTLKGQTLLSRGIRAADVDEYARLIFTVLWGLEKVEQWVVSTGDTVSVTY